VGQDEHPEQQRQITLETRPASMECLVCSSQAASDCQEMAQAFAAHCDGKAALTGNDALLRRVDRVDEWVVCDHCQERLSGEDKVRLMCVWMVIESLRNWIRTEAKLGLKSALPAPPPIQLA